MGNTAINGWLAEVLWLVGGIGVAVATLAGLWLIVAPGQALAMAGRLNREFSIGWLQRALDAPRSSEPWIYRHHRVVGVLLVIATGYFFWRLATGFGASALAAAFAGAAPRVVLEWLAAAATALLVAGNVAGLVVGIIIGFRPSLLKGTEGWANRWVASDKATEFLDQRSDRADGVTRRYPRRVGVVILLATLYIALIGIVLLK